MSFAKYDDSIVKKCEMVYTNRVNKIEDIKVLADGTYLGFKVCILSYGTHPCCYFKLNEGDKFIGEDMDSIPLNCHGGLTFAQETDKDAPMGEGYWLGWDYAHYGDADGSGIFEMLGMSGKKYTTDMLVADLKETIKHYITL